MSARNRTTSGGASSGFRTYSIYDPVPFGIDENLTWLKLLILSGSEALTCPFVGEVRGTCALS
jgi:hypothetical protein